MTEYRQILARVGWLLVAVGILDIGFMVYCIANRISYSSSLNIFAVIAGILLVRGHLGAVRVVTWFSAFMLSGFVLCLFLVFPWLVPGDYRRLVFRLDPVGSVSSALLVVAVLALLLWVYAKLRSPPVVEARVLAGQKGTVPASAFITGSALAVFLAVMLQFTMKGKMAQEAERLAAQQHGSEYKYFVSRMNWGGHHVSARLTAYSDKEMREVSVEWDR